MHIEKVKVEQYQTFLKDKHRPPSQGGVTRAWHQHCWIVEGEKYSFLALGSKKWVYKNDLVSFEWEWSATREYRDIKPETIQTWDQSGHLVVRGERGTKEWRTADTRLPCSRREWND